MAAYWLRPLDLYLGAVPLLHTKAYCQQPRLLAQPVVEGSLGLSAPGASLPKPVAEAVEGLAPGAQQQDWPQPEVVELQALVGAALPDLHSPELLEQQAQVLVVALVVQQASERVPALQAVQPWLVVAQLPQVWSAPHWRQEQE